MSPHRPRRSVDQIKATYEDTLHALRRRFEQLEKSVAQFVPDLDQQALTAAWNSDDPGERNRADGVLSSFEKTHMLLMDLIALSVKLARRIEAIDDESTPAPELLVNAGVISREDIVAIEKQREVRNTSQHIYIQLSMSALRLAVLQQIETTPSTIRNVAAWVESLEPGAEVDT
ncbi:MAG TPA: hypothetical protein VK781_06905 [Solirubrobacteraceae bacterium]|nr:hypothetical protein [Solirubrobacteraceae bacterium]